MKLSDADTRVSLTHQAVTVTCRSCHCDMLMSLMLHAKNLLLSQTLAKLVLCTCDTLLAKMSVMTVQVHDCKKSSVSQASARLVDKCYVTDTVASNVS